MTDNTLRIATRKSLLALTQTRMIASDIKARWPGVQIEEVQITTQGDRFQEKALSAIGGKGLFVSELEEALAQGRADMAVHSMKDMPVAVHAALDLVCVPKREDARDMWIARDGSSFSDAPQGARVGTSSLRRAAQLLSIRPDLTIELLRGNVDTRLRRLDEGVYDAIVLAAAGLRRLGLSTRGHELPVGLFLPAIGQGALAIEARCDDLRVRSLLAHLDDMSTHLAVDAERALLTALQGGCQTPLAGYAQLIDQTLGLRALVAAKDGSRVLRAQGSINITGDAQGDRLLAKNLGVDVAEQLFAQGARELLDSVH